MTDVEARLRQALKAVADRIEPGEAAVPLPETDALVERRGLRPTLAAAAIFAIATVGSVAAWRANDSDKPVDRNIAAGPGPTTTTSTEALGDSVVRVTGGDIVVNLVEAPSVDGRLCLKLTSTTPLTDAPPDVCIDPATPGVTVERMTIGRRTVLYGLGASVASFTASMAEVTVALGHQEALYGPVRAFATIWDVPNLNGVVFGSNVDGKKVSLTAIVGSGLPGFEQNPSTPLPVDVPFGDRMLFAYKHGGQVWAILESGANVRLTGNRVTGFPFVAPDGDTVVFSRDADGIFADTVALDVRTGREQIIGAAASLAFSPDGRLAIVPPVDDEVPRTLLILRPESLDKPIEITLGAVDGSHGLAWSADGRTILVNSRSADGVGTQLSLVDIARKSVGAVEVESAPGETTWRLDRGTARRGWPAVRHVNGGSEIGYLTVDGRRGKFSGVAMKTATAEAALTMSSITGFASVGRVAAQMVSDAQFAFRPADTDAYVIADEEEVFLVNDKGELTYLLSEARGPSAP